YHSEQERQRLGTGLGNKAGIEDTAPRPAWTALRGKAKYLACFPGVAESPDRRQDSAANRQDSDCRTSTKGPTAAGSIGNRREIVPQGSFEFDHDFVGTRTNYPLKELAYG